MNRRDFGKMIAGTGIATAIPLHGVAAAATAQRSKYIYAVALAHNRVDVSAEMISEMFDLRPGTARGLLSRLVRNGVVDAPNAHGIARLAEPLQRIVPQVVECNPAGGYIVKGRLDEMTAKAKELAKKVLQTDQETRELAENSPDTSEPDAEALEIDLEV